MTIQNGPQLGQVYKSPVNVIGTHIENFDVPAMGVRVDRVPIEEKNGEWWHIFSYRANEGDSTWEFLHTKMEWYVTSLSIGIFSHCWLSDYIYDEEGKEVWKKPNALRMVIQKEGNPEVPDPTPSQMASMMVDLSLHIARYYPRVSVYHYIGLLLMRTPLEPVNLNAEILLNFFKMGELVASSRKSRHPKLKEIVKVSKELESSYEEKEIKEFWKVRSRDAAHDYGQSEAISRMMAADCKLWAEELVVKDWMDRGEEIIKRSDRPRFPRTTPNSDSKVE